jgi:hypothetical protein
MYHEKRESNNYNQTNQFIIIHRIINSLYLHTHAGCISLLDLSHSDITDAYLYKIYRNKTGIGRGKIFNK